LLPSRCQEIGAVTPIILPHQLVDEFERIAQDHSNTEVMFSPFASLLRTAVEAVALGPRVAIALRPKAGSWMYLRFQIDELTVEEMTAGQYLAFKEMLAPGEIRFFWWFWFIDHGVQESTSLSFSVSLSLPLTGRTGGCFLGLSSSLG
jgi:hypothetical protein